MRILSICMMMITMTCPIFAESAIPPGGKTDLSELYKARRKELMSSPFLTDGEKQEISQFDDPELPAQNYRKLINERERRKAYIQSHPRLSVAKQKAIDGGFVVKEMSKDELCASLGDPTKINRTVGNSVEEQWVYDRGSDSAIYVYLRNGRVTGWQD